MLATYAKLVEVTAQHGWGEYRAPPAVQDIVRDAYDFNDHALLRFQERLKDAADPHGILAAGPRLREHTPVLVERTDLTPEFIKCVVRHGVSIMPFYRKTDLTDAELDGVARFLTPPR